MAYLAVICCLVDGHVNVLDSGGNVIWKVCSCLLMLVSCVDISLFSPVEINFQTYHLLCNFFFQTLVLLEL